MQYFRLIFITSFNNLTVRTELDFKSKYLFRMCSVVTNLVTSLEIQQIGSATTLFHFGRIRNIYLANRIIPHSSTAESSATSGYVVATDAPAKVRRQLVETWNGIENKPSLFPTVVLIDVSCNHESFSILNFIFSILLIIFPLYSSIFSLCGNIFDLLFIFLFTVSAREKPP